MREYFRRNTDAKYLPYHLNSFDAPFVKRFALRQYDLMTKGTSKAQAYQDVEKEMAAEKTRLFECVSLVAGCMSQCASALELTC
jgi:hypothetical protein